MKELSWWKDREIIHLMSRVAKAGRLDHLRRKIDRINAAVDDGADIEKINEFVRKGKFDGHNIDEMIEQAK
jgi:hypothetical protein